MEVVVVTRFLSCLSGGGGGGGGCEFVKCSWSVGGYCSELNYETTFGRDVW